MVRLSLQCVLWAYLLAVVHPEPSIACEQSQYLLNNQCCDMCPPGKKLVNGCTEHTKTQCLPCGRGEFSDTWSTDTRCHQHRYCEPHSGLQVLREGTSETDTTCTCQEGQHCTSNDCETCNPHTPCGPGFGVKQMATGTSDTICELCLTGFYSNVSSAVEKCHSWTSCEAKGLVVLQEGTNRADVVCGLQPRMRSLLVIPIVLGFLVGMIFLSVYIRKVVRKRKVKVFHPEPKYKGPVEVDFPGHNPAAPVQETLQGCQPVTQEDGKESRISVQERQ